MNIRHGVSDPKFDCSDLLSEIQCELFRLKLTQPSDRIINWCIEAMRRSGISQEVITITELAPGKRRWWYVRQHLSPAALGALLARLKSLPG